MAHMDLPHNHEQLIEQVLSQIPAETEQSNLLHQLVEQLIAISCPQPSADSHLPEGGVYYDRKPDGTN